jgi:hypothetical protein
MRGFFDPELFWRTYRNPVAWLSLAVDLLPVAAVILFGWKAVPLVALYWLENLIIGVFTILRMLGSVAGNISYSRHLHFHGALLHRALWHVLVWSRHVPAQHGWP